MVSHAAIAQHCRVIGVHYGLEACDRVLQFAALSSDPSLEQILATLVCGATLVMRGAEVWTPAELSAALVRDRITVADLPTAYLTEVLAAWRRSGHAPARVPRLLICGGEALTADTVRLWREGPLRSARLINAYGPTEATITATTHEVGADDDARIPIGRPLPGTSAYILDGPSSSGP